MKNGDSLCDFMTSTHILMYEDFHLNCRVLEDKNYHFFPHLVNVKQMRIVSFWFRDGQEGILEESAKDFQYPDETNPLEY